MKLTPDTERLTRRTYESFEIVWDRGSRWTNFRSAAEAQATLDFAAARGTGATGRIERKTFSVDITADRLGLYRPGCEPDEIVEMAR